MRLPLPGRRQLSVALGRREERAQQLPLSVDSWANFFDAFSYGGVGYPFIQLQQTLAGNHEEIGTGFTGYVQGIYRNNGPVFALITFRLLTFSEARFQFRRMTKGRPGVLFGTNELDILDTPWKNATTGDLLSRAIQDVDMAGNFFCVRRGNELRRMRPDWVTIVAGSKKDTGITMDSLDSELIGYLYHPGGPAAHNEPVVLGPEEVCHFAPIPDPLFRFRGMSWLQPIVREVTADNAMTSHKLKFFENGASPNMVVKLDPSISKEAFDGWVEKLERGHTGLANAYRTLYLGGGADVTVVGKDLRQLEFSVTQAAGEQRLANAAQVPSILVGFSEGLDASTMANYKEAKSRYIDMTLRPMWRNFAGSVATLVKVPGGAHVWYDDRDIPFLHDDLRTEAEIRQIQAATIASLISAGYTPESVVTAVMSGDYTQLKHTGLFSVQLQPPGELGEPGGPTTAPQALPPPAEPAPTAANGHRAMSRAEFVRRLEHLGVDVRKPSN